MKAAWFAAALVALATPLASWAQMYKCVDERGVTSYSDKPRPGCKGGVVNIKPIPPVSGKAAGRTEDSARDDADFKRRQLERAQMETLERAKLDQQKRRCLGLKNEFLTLDSPRRIVVDVNAKGERVYMDDAARQKRLAELREVLSRCD